MKELKDILVKGVNGLEIRKENFEDPDLKAQIDIVYKAKVKILSQKEVDPKYLDAYVNI